LYVTVEVAIDIDAN